MRQPPRLGRGRAPSPIASPIVYRRVRFLRTTFTRTHILTNRGAQHCHAYLDHPTGGHACVGVLLDAGADVNRATLSRKTALMFACERADPSTVSLLILAGKHSGGVSKHSKHRLCFAFVETQPTISKLIGSWSARRRPLSLPLPSPRWTKPSWTRRCRRSDRARTTPPARWAQEPAGHSRAAQRTERTRLACWGTACSTHTPHPTATPNTPPQWDDAHP